MIGECGSGAGLGELLLPAHCECTAQAVVVPRRLEQLQTLWFTYGKATGSVPLQAWRTCSEPPADHTTCCLRNTSSSPAMPTPPPPHTQEDRTRMGQDGTRGPVPEPQSSRGWAEEGGTGSQRAPDCNRVGDLSRCPSWAAKTCPQIPVLRGQQTTWGLESLGNVASAWRLAAATVF